MIEERRFARYTWLQRHFWIVPLAASVLVIGLAEIFERQQGDSVFFDLGSGLALRILLAPLLITAAFCAYLAFIRMFAGCYGLLAAKAMRGQRLHLDEIACLTSLSNVEIVAGVVRHYLPVAVRMLTLLIAVLAVWQFLGAIEQDLSTFLRATRLSLLMWLYSLGTTVFYSLAWITMGRGRKLGPDLPWVFGLHLLMWLVLAAGSRAAAGSLRWAFDAEYGPELQHSILVVLALALLIAVPTIGQLLAASCGRYPRSLAPLSIPLLLAAYLLALAILSSVGMGANSLFDPYFWHPGSFGGSELLSHAVFEAAIFTPFPVGLAVEPKPDMTWGSIGPSEFFAPVAVISLLMLLSVVVTAAKGALISVERHRRGLP